MLFTGNLISGKKAEEMGLVFQSVPLKELDDTVLQLTDRIKGVPKNQLMMMKMMVNQAYENMGLYPAPSQLPLCSTALPGTVPKASGLSSVLKKSVSSRLFLKETPEILYGAVKTKTGQDQLKTRQNCWGNTDLVCPQKNQWKLFHSNFH